MRKVEKEAASYSPTLVHKLPFNMVLNINEPFQMAMLSVLGSSDR